MLEVTTPLTPLTPLTQDDREQYALRVGDPVIVQRDVLAEIGREAAGLPPMWRFLPAGVRGKLIGWRDRDRDSRAIVDVHGTDLRLVVFVSACHIARSPRPFADPPRRTRPGRRRTAR